MRVRLLRPAVEDLAAGRRFYNRQGRIGDYFLDSLFSEIDSLVPKGGVHPNRFGFRRLLAKRFPFAVYYHVIGNDVVVYRVLACRRDPRRIQRSLTRENVRKFSPQSFFCFSFACGSEVVTVAAETAWFGLPAPAPAA